MSLPEDSELDVLRSDLLDFIRKSAGPGRGEIRPDTPLFSSGLLDSLLMMDLIAFVEGRAGIKVRTLDMAFENLDNVERLLRYIRSRRTEDEQLDSSGGS